jgi:predicted MFS family arabinose efflux permease
LGLALAMVVFGWWVTIVAWPMILYAAAGVCALGMLLMAAYRRAPPTSTTVPGPRFRIGRRGFELALLAGLVWATFNTGAIIFLSFSPTFLIERGWSAASASSLASLVMWLCLPLILLGGHVADRTGRYDLVIGGTALLTALLMAAMPVLPGPIPILILVGVIWGAPAGPIMAMPQVLPAQERAAGFGIFFTVYYAYMAAVPAAAGLILDLSGDSRLPLLFAAAVMASTAPILWLFRWRATGLGAPDPRAA